MVDQARSAGAQVVTGGGAPTSSELSRGYSYEPTVVDAVSPEMPIAHEEVFGPVLAVTKVSTEDEGAPCEWDPVWARRCCLDPRPSRAHHVASRIKAGQVYVNTYGAGGGVEPPFGGYKQSGYGRHKGIEGALGVHPDHSEASGKSSDEGEHAAIR